MPEESLVKSADEWCSVKVFWEPETDWWKWRKAITWQTDSMRQEVHCCSDKFMESAKFIFNQMVRRPLLLQSGSLWLTLRLSAARQERCVCQSCFTSSAKLVKNDFMCHNRSSHTGAELLCDEKKIGNHFVVCEIRLRHYTARLVLYAITFSKQLWSL